MGTTLDVTDGVARILSVCRRVQGQICAQLIYSAADHAADQGECKQKWFGFGSRHFCPKRVGRYASEGRVGEGAAAIPITGSARSLPGQLPQLVPRGPSGARVQYAQRLRAPTS